MLARLTDLLHVGPSPHPYAVTMTLAELGSRSHELPAPYQRLRVFGSGARSAVDWLIDRGRTAVEVGPADLANEVWEDGPFRLWRPNPALERLVDVLPTGSRVLDFGCGSGRDAVALACLGFPVVAIDHLPDALSRACDLEMRYRTSGVPIHFRTDLDIKCEFEAAVMINLYSSRLLRSVADRVKPGGWLLLEAMTAESAATYGKPKLANCLEPQAIPALLPDYRIVTNEAIEHADRITERLLTQRRVHDVD